MEYIKKSITGYKLTDAEPTHIAITLQEYKELEKVKNNYNKLLNLYKELEREKINEIEKCNKKLVAWQEKASELESLNKNLLRIARERANAVRELTPKKEHLGYLVKYSEEYKYRYNKTTYNYMKSTLQTPFDAGLEFNNVKSLILEEASKWGTAIGIDKIILNSNEQTITKNELKEKNVVIEFSLKNNVVKGFWEVIIIHTKPLTITANVRKQREDKNNDK